MRSHLEEHKGCGDAFIIEGFTNWKKSERFRVHLRDVYSSHNQAWRNCQALMKQKQQVEGVMCKQSNQVNEDYQIHLIGIIDYIRYLLQQGITFCGNDESISSRNKGNFLELMNFLVNYNKDIYKVGKNCRGNLKLTSPDIQKDIVKVAATVTTQVILDYLGDDLFAILIDESCEISAKEQMVVIIHYVNNEEKVIEHFLDIYKVGKKFRGNLKLTSPDIEKDIVKVAATVTTQVILDYLGDDLFAILIDESCEISAKEQMVVIIHYVNNEEKVIEHFLDIYKVGKKIRGNLKLTSPDIQKDIVKVAATVTTQVILDYLGDDLFAILTDESCEISAKEQMVVIIHYVNNEEKVIEHFLDIYKVGKNCRGNLKLTSPDIQKDIVKVAATVTTQVILDYLGDDLFAILIDESCEISAKEQMVVIIHYVNNEEKVIEHFLDIYKVGKNCRGNLKLTSPDIQKDIVKVAATVTTQVILDYLGDDLFAILIDESCEISAKEQMVVIIHYVNNEEKVIEHFLDIYKVGKNCRGNLKLTSPDIQKDIVKVAATVTTQVILDYLGDDLFAILIDESCEISAKEQMVVIIHYVNNEEKVIEHFLDIYKVGKNCRGNLKLTSPDIQKDIVKVAATVTTQVILDYLGDDLFAILIDESCEISAKEQMVVIIHYVNNEEKVIEHFLDIYKVGKNCRGNLKLTSPDIQKDIVKVAATVTTQVILDYLGDDLFAILIDESCEISAKEQMVVIIHYVNNEEKVIEHFLDIYKVGKNCRGNLKLTSPDIQKDIVKVAATVTTQVILDYLGDDLFAILIDESCEISAKEQMVVIIHYVNNEEKVIEHFLDIYKVGKNCRGNLKLTSPDIQKDIVKVAATVTTQVILDYLGDDLFAILIDESCEISAKEQMVVIIHYVNNEEKVIEHFLDIYKVGKNCRGNLKLTSPDIQKDIVKVAATVTTQVILDYLGDDLFAILIDESCEISAKEQMVVIIHYVNNEEKVIEHFLDIYKVGKNCRGNLKLTSPDIQKDIVKVAATVTTQVILDYLGDDLFAILIDESCEISAKEQMVVIIHYVNNEEKVIEHFLDIYKVGKNCRGNLKLTSPDIQKDIVKVAATVTTQVILDYLGDDLFAILIDESCEISAKEQMVVIIHYVNNEEKVIEHFLASILM
ncbi:hypothetical protein KIW84_051950 [Lathyrus oleraceus]|uniref:DUF4371 domain-containing protein n=1 Tax=Pisum sativum TaxID=3888 RepID=A0A9D4WLE4_PEA|nr:hypothetical protein KIW84_051950 [Pisum sativum]